MTISEINQKFLAHRRDCYTCRTPGMAVCSVGLDLLKQIICSEEPQEVLDGTLAGRVEAILKANHVIP